jgi:hypothetical protein
MNKIIALILLVISTAGVWFGVILVILVVGLVVWLFSKARS